jgi:Stress responsive A/B Barrel Domain
MFIHHVYFTLKNPDSKEDLNALVAGLNAMRPIETFRAIHIGVPASTNRDVIDRSYSASWLLIFDNLEDQEIYQVHPLHKKFVETCSHLWSKVVVYDSVNA